MERFLIQILLCKLANVSQYYHSNFAFVGTYSNLYNHPKVIEEPWRKSNKIELTKKLGIPKESIQPKGLTRKQIQELEKEQAVDTVKVAPVRRKGETAEEKKQRKALVKEERKVSGVVQFSNYTAWLSLEHQKSSVLNS